MKNIVDVVYDWRRNPDNLTENTTIKASVTRANYYNFKMNQTIFDTLMQEYPCGWEYKYIDGDGGQHTFNNILDYMICELDDKS